MSTTCKPDTPGDNSLVLNHIRITGLSERVLIATVNGSPATINYDDTTKVTTIEGFTHNIAQQLNMVKRIANQVYITVIAVCLRTIPCAETDSCKFFIYGDLSLIVIMALQSNDIIIAF